MTYMEDTACAPAALEALTTGAPWTTTATASPWIPSRRALSPSHWISLVKDFTAGLKAQDLMLFRMGWILQGIVPLFGLLAWMKMGVGVIGENPWIKPIKFATSFSTFVLTVIPFLYSLRVPDWQRTLARRAVALGVTAEMLCLTAQAWRLAHSHFGQTTFVDTMISQATSAMITVITAVSVWLLVVYLGHRGRIDVKDDAMVIAMRLSLIIFVVGNAVGGYMLARGSHTVGAPDGGPGLPFLNWSSIAGDLRIAHFIAIHAIQILPVLAFVAAQVLPQAGLKMRRGLVLAASSALFLLVAATFVQAALGHPLLPAAVQYFSRR